MLRDLQFRDLPIIISYPSNFPFPDLKSGLYCIQKALFSGDRLVGAAFLKLTCEAILMLDPDVQGLTKARVLDEAFEALRAEATEKYGLDQVHVFVLPETDEKYAEFLKRHFGFKNATGIPLVLTKEENNG